MKRSLLLAAIALTPGISGVPARAAADKPIIFAQRANEETPNERQPRRQNGQNGAQNGAQNGTQNNPPRANTSPPTAPSNSGQTAPSNSAQTPRQIERAPAVQNNSQQNTQTPQSPAPRQSAPPATTNQTQTNPAQPKQTQPIQAQPNQTPTNPAQRSNNPRDNRREPVQQNNQQNNQPRNNQQNTQQPTNPPKLDQRNNAQQNRQNQNNQPAPNGQAPGRANSSPTNPNAAQTNSGARSIDALRSERKETREGDRVVIREGDRTIVREGNRTIIRHDEVARFRFGGANVQFVQRGENREAVVVRPGGVRIVSVLDANGRLIRRSRWVNGREFVLIQNRPAAGVVIVNLPPPVIRIPSDRYIVEYRNAPRPLIYETLVAGPVMPLERAYTLDEVRYNDVLRERMPRIDIDTITFDTGSWEVRPDQAQLLAPIAEAMQKAVAANPNEVFMIEGFTDAVGSDEDNLSLSDRRAESVAEILSRDFQIPPENMTTQGYGKQALKVQTEGPEERNRRVTVQRITPLLTGDSGAGNR